MRKTDSIHPGHYIIAIGASAGGLEALQEFLSHLPDELNNSSIVIAQHLSPSHKSRLVELLSRETDMVVTEAVHGMDLEPGMVYITPPNKEITVKKEKLSLTKPPSDIGPKPSVNVLFQSLASQSAEFVIGIILSGTGSDGAEGVKVLKKAGGLILVQEPFTAKYDGMPLAAVQTEVVDAVLPPDKMGNEILEYVRNPNTLKVQKELEKNEDNSLVRIFELLNKRTGTDFSNYKSATIGRRLQKRMTSLNISSIAEYLTYVEEQPNELEEMFKVILIGVTSFFRDEDAFSALKVNLKEIIDHKTSLDPIRVWVPGCSTGEEAYSIAILINKLLNDRSEKYNIQIFATDIDDRAISIARKGVYSKEAVENVSSETLEKYFIKKREKYELIKPIKQMVLFSKNDLISNPPFLKLDLITCRNLLIYFDASLQQQIIPIFHYALNPNGLLFLGKSETVGQFTDLFTTIDGKNKLFKRKSSRNLNPIRISAFKARHQIVPKSNVKSKNKKMSVSERVKETIFNTYEHPYVVIDGEYNIIETYGDVRLFLTLPSGSMHANLINMVNKELKIEVRSVVSKAVKNSESVKSNIRKFELYDKEYYVRITVKPLIYTDSSEELFIVFFEQLDISSFVSKGVADDKEGVIDTHVQELEHELAITKEHLQTYIEEIETSNEELQSLNEELQSTNEELHSSNEELETTNEELQSTNEEVRIAYSELKKAHVDLEEKEDLLRIKEQYQKALLDNKLQALFLVDTSHQIIATNELAEEFVELLSGTKLKTGDSISDLTSADHMKGFIEEIKKAFLGKIVAGERKEKDKNGNVRWFSYNITPVTNSQGGVDVISVGLIDITEQKEFAYKLNSTERLLHSVFDTAASGICITDEKGRIVNVNSEYCNIYGYDREEFIGKNFSIIALPENREAMQKMHDDFISGKEVPDAEWNVQRKDGKVIEILSTSRLLEYDDGNRFKITSIKDISENKKYRNLLQETQTTANVGGWEYDTINRELAWTDEVYNIFELPAGTETDLKLMQSHFQQEAGVVLKSAIDNALENGHPIDLELECTTTGDEHKWVRITANPVRVHNKTIKLFGTIQNVSERKNMEQYLQDTLVMLHERNKEQICLYNVSRINELELSEEELITKAIGFIKQGFHYPECTELEIVVDDRVYRSESYKKTKLSLHSLSKLWPGRKVEINAALFEDQEKLIFLDIEQELIDAISEIISLKLYQKETRLNLERSNERYEYVTRATSDAIWEYVPKTDNLFWGEGFKTLFGYDRISDETGITRWMNNIHPDDADTIRDSVEELLTGQDSRWDCQYRFRKADDTYTFVSDQAVIISDELGKPVRVIGAMKDISGQKIREFQKSLTADISLSFSKSDHLKGALNETLNHIVDTIGFEFAEFWTAESEKKQLQLIACRYSPGVSEEFSPNPEGVPLFKIGNGLPGNVLKKKKPLFWRNLDKRKSFIRNKKARASGLKTGFAFPLMDADEVIGVLVFAIKEDLKSEPYYISLFLELSFHLASEMKRKRIEEELFRIFNSAPDGIIVAGFDGFLKKVNPAICEILGYSEEELLTTPFIEFVYPVDRERTIQEYENANSGSGSSYFENRYVTKSGKVIWLSWTFKVFPDEQVAYSVAKDITEQKRIEELLDRTNQLSKIGSWELDLRNNELYWTDITREIHEEEPGFVPTLESAINYYKEGGESRERIQRAVDEAMKHGTPWDLELMIITAKGNERWVRAIGEADMVNGKCVRLYGGFQDITESKKAEEYLIELNRTLEQRTKELATSNTELEQFAFVASHDLQEPLRMITSFLTLLEKRYEDLLDEKGKKYIFYATDGAKRMRQIILDLLDYSRVGRIDTDREEVDLNKVLEDVKSLQKKLIKEKKATVTWDEMPVVSAARVAMQQLFLNLMQNALSYHKDGGKPVVKIWAEDLGTHWKFFVQDNGIGIDPEYQEKIFILFQRLHDKHEYSGTGVGLAVCKKIVLDHGGEIGVESIEGKGSTFWFTIEKGKDEE